MKGYNCIRNIYDEPNSAFRILNNSVLNIGMFGLEIISYESRVRFSKYYVWSDFFHKHSFYELHFCLGGCCTYYVGDTEIKLFTNSFILISPYIKHYIKEHSSDFCEFIWGFDIVSYDKSKEWIPSFVHETVIVDRKSASDGMLNIMSSILSISLSPKLEYYSTLKSLLYSFLIETASIFLLDETCLKSMYTNENNKTNVNIKININTIKKYISDNLELNLRASDIAKMLNISERHLNRILRKEYNLTIGELKHNIQIETCKNLLLDTELLLSEIAQKTGFSDEYAMGKTFKTYEKISPGKFRKNHKE